MTKFYGYVQPKTGWLYDRSDKYWVMVASGATYDIARNKTMEIIRAMNRNERDPVLYVTSIRSHKERYHDRLQG